MTGRARAMGATAAALLAGLLAIGWFAAPVSSPAPRAGRVLPGGVVVAWSPGYRVSFLGFERLHPFDIGKLDRIAAHLVDEGLLGFDDFAVPAPIGDEQLARVHDPAYLAALHELPALRAALEVDLPDVFPRVLLESRVRRPFRLAVGGYNDVAWAIHQARAGGFTGTVLIVDTDAHQGDGNHAFFADDPTVVSFSMHGAALFPQPKLRGDYDIALPPLIADERFLDELAAALDALLDQPVGLVIHVAGSDVLADDPLGNMGITVPGLVARDRLVFDAARDRGVPFVHLLAGGYGPNAAAAQAQSVSNLLRAARGGR